jgi:hypothetical protein
MKTTLDIDDDLLRRAKQAALDRDTTLRAIVEEALERALGPAAAPVPIRTVVWPAVVPAGSSWPVEDEGDWLARIKAVRYGEETGDASVSADPAAAHERARAPKRRTR